MKFPRLVLVIFLLLLVIGAAWIWWSLPRRIDMAAYAPADSLAYLEFNSLDDVTQAIEQGTPWQTIAPIIRLKTSSENRWLRSAARAGLGPARAVIFARAQVALVLVGMNTVEENDTLRVKPEAAVLIETHTAKWRIRSTATDTVQKLADFAYGRSVCIEHTDDADYVECAAPDGQRKIVAAIDGSLIVVGNSMKALRNCLDARRGARPSLKTDTELQLTRASLKANNSLAFGYVSSSNSAKLFSWAAPLLMGRVPSNDQLDQLLTASASKILHGVSWTSNSSAQGIEDRFVFSLDSGVAARLKPAFETVDTDNGFWRYVPRTFQSLTIYRSKDPVAAWTSLDAAVALKLNAVSSVIVGTLLKSGLSVYGIENPKILLGFVSAPIITFKPSPLDTGSVLFAKITDEAKLRDTIAHEVFDEANLQILSETKNDPSDKFVFTAVIHNGYLLVGRTEDVRTCLRALRSEQVVEADIQRSLTNKIKNNTAAGIVTYTNDEARVRSFTQVIAMSKGLTLTEDEMIKVEDATKPIAFSSTETSLKENNIERKTNSAFGMFSTLLSFVQPESSNGPLR